jgi:hypothetical protein
LTACARGCPLVHAPGIPQSGDNPMSAPRLRSQEGPLEAPKVDLWCLFSHCTGGRSAQVPGSDGSGRLLVAAPSPSTLRWGDHSMRRPVRLTSWRAVGMGTLLVAGLIAAPALAGHANMAAAGPRRNGSGHAHSTAKAWKSGEWSSDRRPAKAWRKGGGRSERRLAKSCAKVTKAWKKRSVRRPAQQCETVSQGSVVRTAPVLRQTAQPTRPGSRPRPPTRRSQSRPRPRARP